MNSKRLWPKWSVLIFPLITNRVKGTKKPSDIQTKNLKFNHQNPNQCDQILLPKHSIKVFHDKKIIQGIQTRSKDLHKYNDSNR